MGTNKLLQVIVRILIVVSLLMIGLFLIYQLVKLTYPFFIAAVLAFLINPIVTFLEHRVKLPRTVAVLSGISLLIGVAGGVMTLIIVKLIDGIQYLSQLVPSQIENISITIQTYVNNQILPLWLKGLGFIDHLEDTQKTAIENGIEQIGIQFATLLGDIGHSVANNLSNVVGALPITLTVFVFIILSLYFISKDWVKFNLSIKNRLPHQVVSSAVTVFNNLKSKVIGFLTAQCVLISITAIVNFIGLLILKVEKPFTIALILGLVDLLPYLGTGLVLIPWGLYSLVKGELFLGSGLLILYGLTIIVRQFAEPKVLSSSLGLNPLATLISLFVGIQIFGFIGLVIGPVVLVLLLSLYQAKVFDGLWKYVKGNG